MIVGIVGSRKYENKKKIKDFIFKLKKNFNNIVICSGGCLEGADKYAKKYAIEFECSYKEFNPAHTVYNLYSACRENYYGKKYNVRYYFLRNAMLAKYCDIVVGFIQEGDDSNGTNYTLKEAKKNGKKTLIIS